MIALMIFLTILFMKFTELSKVVKSMQRAMNENNNPGPDFHIRQVHKTHNNFYIQHDINVDNAVLKNVIPEPGPA